MAVPLVDVDFVSCVSNPVDTYTYCTDYCSFGHFCAACRGSALSLSRFGNMSRVVTDRVQRSEEPKFMLQSSSSCSRNAVTA